MSYMDSVEIRALSRRIPAIVDATPEELSFWMDEAYDVINAFCQQDFSFESQVTKPARATTGTLVYLPKPLTGDISIGLGNGNVIFSVTNTNTILNDPFQDAVYGSSDFEFYPGNFMMGYTTHNTVNRSPNAETLYVTGDWGYAISEEALLVAFVNALRAAYEAHRADTTYHLVADALNQVLSPAATDSATAQVLLSELQTRINAHMGDVTFHTNADTDVSTAPIATDMASAFVLADELKAKYNAHLARDANSTVAIHLVADTTNTVRESTDNINAVMPRPIRRAFLRLVQRIAIRDDAEDHRQINSPYSSETLGDGYSYDLSNGTLRNLIRPEEAQMLLPYVNRGRIVI